ncbi:MAG TPA: protein-L-isoaspartate(D-aspartate) O-methyltransferase [Candidatus Limnocylindrales bacterium]|nr:protein-L-isoaspartate(D-aspartate) O-methyltransferase [Candidatus Limnocylindrales bacterium]
MSSSQPSDNAVILVVDDDAGALELTRRSLERRMGCDYRVMGEESPQRALDLLRRLAEEEGQVALVLADVNRGRSSALPPLSARARRSSGCATSTSQCCARRRITRRDASRMLAAMDAQAARLKMVEQQLRGRGVRAEAVLTAMATVPRERFVSPSQARAAYDDSPLPIGAGQTISQPYVVALMVEALELDPSHRALEVGSGSGYAAAVMSRICARVYGVERHAELVEAARAALDRLGYANVTLRHADGTLGWPDEAPFDAILVSAGGPTIPQALREQMAVGGRMVIPVGTAARVQHLVRVTREGEGDWSETDLGEVAFVPLIGEQGWEDRPGQRGR